MGAWYLDFSLAFHLVISWFGNLRFWIYIGAFQIALHLEVETVYTAVSLMSAPTAEQLLSVAVQAAAAASDAAQALKDFAKTSEESGRQRFSEASKIIKQPDNFGSEDVDLDQKTWRDFLLNFKSWLFYADGKFESELRFVEEHPKVAIELSKLNGEEQSRALQLYSIFTGVLRGKPLRLLRQQEDRNGLEVYRQLLQQFQPSSKSRALSLLSAYMQAPAFVKEKTLHEQVLGLERLRSEYQKCAGENVSDDLALSILVKCLPNHIRQYVQLQMSDATTYDSIRNYVMSYEVVTSSWRTSKVHNELGVVGSYSSTSNSGPSPMEIDAITWKGKGKQKGKHGKGKGKGKDGKAKAFHPGIRIKREKEKEKIFPKENRVVLARVRIRVQIRSWIPINVPIATSLAIERLIAGRCSKTKLQVLLDKFKTMVVQIKMMEVATMVHHRAMHHLLVFKTLELFPKLGHTCPMCKI